MTEQTYFCKSCKAMLFSFSDMRKHIVQTGHEEYDVHAKWFET